MADSIVDTEAFREAARALAATGRRIHAQGWAPATSGNYSLRLDADHCAITVSGRDKSRLDDSDIMVVDLDGRPVSAGRPSAETELHTHLYRRFPGVGAVLHSHSPAATVLTMHGADKEVRLQGYELLKALDGIETHEHCLDIPVLENSQNMAALARAADKAIDDGAASHAYLIRGHGLYTWAGTLASCYRQLEALEFLLAVSLEGLRLRGPSS